MYLFQREFYFYNSVRDLFQMVVEDESEDSDEILKFIPKPLTLPGPMTFNRGIEEPLICENASSLGYKMWKDEFNGLDLAHAEISLEAYGKLHALGLVLFEKKIVEDENFVKLLDVDIIKLFTSPLMEIVDKGFESFKEWIRNNDNDEETVAKLKHELNDRKYVRTTEKLFKEGKSHELQIIQHGDARSNNILFKYAEDGVTPIDAMLVDFQASGFCHPFFDLVYFFALSLSADVLIQNYHPLLER